MKIYKLAFHSEEEAKKVYNASLNRPYWKEISQKFPEYNNGGTIDALKWVRNEIAKDFRNKYSEEEWVLIESELTSKIHGGLT